MLIGGTRALPRQSLFNSIPVVYCETKAVVAGRYKALSVSGILEDRPACNFGLLLDRFVFALNHFVHDLQCFFREPARRISTMFGSRQKPEVPGAQLGLSGAILRDPAA
jgi:hypothetical protein